MRIIGLDLGAKTLGIAISDELGIIARSLTTFRFAEDKYDEAIAYLIKICNEYQVKTVILGLPKHMNGDLGIRANISIDFKKAIEEKTDIKVVLFDERLTTSLVDKAMLETNIKRKDRKAKKDELAAQIILQNYLDRSKL